MLRFTAAATTAGPAYTARMLLSEVVPSIKDTEAPKLKPFSHFTLACTAEDESARISEAFEALAKHLGKPVSFTAEEVVNLGGEAQALWGVKLNLDSHPELRDLLGSFFDSMMCPERNGTLYTWKPALGQTTKCPHITIGAKIEDKTIADRLVAEGCVFVFDQVDYKKVGPHDPHLSMSLNAEKAFGAAFSS